MAQVRILRFRMSKYAQTGDDFYDTEFDAGRDGDPKLSVYVTDRASLNQIVGEHRAGSGNSVPSSSIECLNLSQLGENMDIIHTPADGHAFDLRDQCHHVLNLPDLTALEALAHRLHAKIQILVAASPNFKNPDECPRTQIKASCKSVAGNNDWRKFLTSTSKHQTSWVKFVA